MRVKFHKGPYHGKTRDANMKDLYDVVCVAVSPNYRKQAGILMNNVPAFAQISPSISIAEYRVKWMTLNGQKFPATHPDGSIFLEYVRSKQ